MTSESEFRAAIVREALSWKGTPYRSSGKVKGAGVNCAMFPYCVGRDSGMLPADAPPPQWFTPQFAAHTREERLLEYVKAYGGREIEESAVLPGDVVVYKSGLSHGHMAIVLGLPQIIHVTPACGCELGLLNEGVLAQFSRKFFTFWKAIR